MLCGLVITAGKGNKLWPLSTDKKPVEFTNLIDGESMVQVTVNRMRPIIPIERIFVLTSIKCRDLVKEQIPDLPEKNIISEPVGRGTAASITLAAMMVNKTYKNTNLLISYCDYVIEKEDVFREMVKKYNAVLGVVRDSIIAFGIKVDKAETGFGYILAKTNGKHKCNSSTFYRVDKYIEKPTLEAANRFLADSNYLWNSGILLCSVEKILSKISRYLPKTYNALKGIYILESDKIDSYINTHYKLTDEISIEEGILERDNEVYVVPVEIGWENIYDWGFLENNREKDPYGNILIGKDNKAHGFNNLVISASKKITVDGLNNIYVIENNGQVVVCKKELINNLQNIG